jgi:hypothetical protein
MGISGAIPEMDELCAQAALYLQPKIRYFIELYFK